MLTSAETSDKIKKSLEGDKIKPLKVVMVFEN